MSAPVGSIDWSSPTATAMDKSSAWLSLVAIQRRQRLTAGLCNIAERRGELGSDVRLKSGWIGPKTLVGSYSRALTAACRLALQYRSTARGQGSVWVGSPPTYRVLQVYSRPSSLSRRSAVEIRWLTSIFIKLPR
jgi:hypothetical protein